MATQKVAIIVGGGSGMGAGAARKLAADGFDVAILSSSGKGELLGKELGGIGMTGSNQSNDDLKRVIDATMEKWDRIDVLVNSAGHGPRAPVLDLTDEDWHLGMELFSQRCPSDPAGDSNNASSEVRRNHQHLHVRRLRA